MPYRDETERHEYAKRYYLANRQRLIKAAHEYKKTHAEERLCRKCSASFQTPLTEIKRGGGLYCSRSCTPKWNKGMKGMQPWMNISGLSPSPETQFKKGSSGFSRKHTEETKRKISMLQQGVDDVKNWGGYTTEKDKQARRKFRVSYQKIVFMRDDYTCQICFERGGNLQVDHINSWRNYPELRFELDNCRTLCMACHYYVTFKRKMPKGTIWGHNFSRRITP